MADPSAIFTIAEARAFDKAQLANTSQFPDATVTAAEAEIREQFYQICSASFIPKTETDYWTSGAGYTSLLLPFTHLISVSAAVIYNADGSVNETLDAADITDLAVHPSGVVTRRSLGVWLAGWRNIKITFKHGYAAVPAPIKRAALIVAANILIPTNLSDRTTNMSDGNMTFSLAVAGRTNQWYGIPYVDSVLQQYNSTLPGLA